MPTLTRLLTAALLITLALYCLAGLFAQPLADDLTFIALAKLGNPIAQQYATWQGRYGYSLLMGVLMPLAPNLIVKIMPAVLIVGMVFAVYRLLRGRVVNPLLASGGLTLAFMLGLPSVWQSFFWYGSSTNYVIPIILSIGILAWLWR